jgi:phosphatidate cytidylyltransferase
VATTLILASSWVGGLPGLAVSVAIALIANLFLVLLRGTEGFIKNATASAFALLYPGFVAGFIFLLARSGEGFSYIATLVILVGCNDTFAYVFGVLLGKHPLAPKISPKKTWEGFVGGLIFTSIGSALAFYYLLDHHPAIGALAGFAGVLAATVGDLVESAIKRDLSIKDMGTLLPGHGGMLDRLDSALITAPVMWCCIELLKRFA